MGLFVSLLILVLIIVLVGIFLKSLVRPLTNKITLFERRGRFDHCEGKLSENGTKWHFNDARDPINYDQSYPTGYTLPETWQTWDRQQGAFTVTRNYQPDPPTFLERWFNLTFPGFYFMVNQKNYRNFRPVMQYTDKSQQEINTGMNKRFSYTDGSTRISFYIKNDISDFIYFQRTYEVMLKVVTGVVVNAQNPYDRTPEFLENLELGLHFRIRVMTRDPKFMVYISDSMADEIMSGLTQVANDVAVRFDYLSIISSMETTRGANNRGFVNQIVNRLRNFHSTPRLQSGEWKFPTWNLLSLKLVNVVGWNEKDILYIKTISERAMKIQQKLAERSELENEEKNVLIKNRINVSKAEAVGEGERKSLNKLRPALVKMVDEVGETENKVLRHRPVHPDIDRASDALEVTGVKALSLGTQGIVPTFETGRIVDSQDIVQASLGRVSNPQLPEADTEEDKKEV